MIYDKLQEFDHHEIVVDLSVHSSKLRGFIAIHNTALGPALGGTRVFPYISEKEALKDALRLSHAMTYKCAISGLPFGGGKGVIIADPTSKDLQEMLREYAVVVKRLNGKFFTGEDVGLNEKDVQYMLNFSPYFIGKTGSAGDPSEYAALSCFMCLTTALEFKKKKIKNAVCTIKGVGKTGSHLVKLLSEYTTNITVADINAVRISMLKKKYPFINSVSPKAIHMVTSDVYSPCAMGQDITDEKIKTIKSKIICGTANNQLANPKIGDELMRKGILYVPDFIANAGGLIDVADELLENGYDRWRVIKNIHNLHMALKKILSISKNKKIAPNNIAIRMAEKIYAYA